MLNLKLLLWMLKSQFLALTVRRLPKAVATLIKMRPPYGSIKFTKKIKCTTK